MKKCLYLVLGLFFAFHFTAALFAGDVELVLTLQSDRTLPGIPVGFKLTATNNSNAAVALPDSALLRVTPAGQASFIALWDPGETEHAYFNGLLDRGSAGPVAALAPLMPGEPQEFWFPVDGSLFTPECFNDYRLSWPGTYRLQMILDRHPERILKSETSPDPRAFEKSIISNEATLTVEIPQGEDAVVWKRMQEITKGRGWAADRWGDVTLADEIWEKYRNCTYAGYVIGIVRFIPPKRNTVVDSEALMQAKTAALTEFISKNPSHPLASIIYDNLAAYAWIEMHRNLTQRHDPAGAQSAYEKWQNYLKAVADSSWDLPHKNEARKKMKSWEQFQSEKDEE